MSLGQEPERIAQEPVPVVAIDLVDLIPMPVAKVVEVVEPEPEPEPEPEDRRVMRISAYTAHDKGMDGHGITTSGEMVQEGRTIAAAENIPFGAEIFIPALDTVYTVTDRGGAINRGRLDLYMDKRADAIRFGVQELEVIIKQ